jgi:hypothetical protein
MPGFLGVPSFSEIEQILRKRNEERKILFGSERCGNVIDALTRL